MDPIRIVITYDPKTNNVGIEGPLDQRMLIYGILETAKDAIHDLHREKGKTPTSGVVIPPPNWRLPHAGDGPSARG